MMRGEFKDRAREAIVARSIEVLRDNGVGPDKISETMLRSFAIDPETVQRLLEQTVQNQR